jgi:hypothetical protein
MMLMSAVTRLLLPLDQDRERNGKLAGDFFPGPARLDKRHYLALVIGGAACADNARPVGAGLDERLERVVFPELDRIHRLHVVMTIEKRRGTWCRTVMANDDGMTRRRVCADLEADAA